MRRFCHLVRFSSTRPPGRRSSSHSLLSFTSSSEQDLPFQVAYMSSPPVTRHLFLWLPFLGRIRGKESWPNDYWNYLLTTNEVMKTRPHAIAQLRTPFWHRAARIRGWIPSGNQTMFNVPISWLDPWETMDMSVVRANKGSFHFSTPLLLSNRCSSENRMSQRFCLQWVPFLSAGGIETKTRINERMNERIDGWKNEWTNEIMDNKAGYTAHDAPSMRTFHLRK